MADRSYQRTTGWEVVRLTLRVMKLRISLPPSQSRGMGGKAKERKRICFERSLDPDLPCTASRLVIQTGPSLAGTGCPG